MPLHSTPSLSRREFLKRAALAGAALMLPHELLAGQDDSHWALLSDTHIAADSSLVFRDVHLTSQLHKAVGEVLTSQRPAGVFINGDCALKDGQPGDYVTLT